MTTEEALEKDSELQHLKHYTEGYKDELNGKFECPYSPDSARANSWHDGHEDAAEDKRRILAEVPAFSFPAVLAIVTLAALLGTSLIVIVARSSAINELNEKIQQQRESIAELYYGTGCGSLPCEKCETTWRSIESDHLPQEMHGIAPINCMENDATVWVNPYHYDEGDGSWSFKCIPNKRKP